MTEKPITIGTPEFVKMFVDTADSSWFPRILRTLARDYPEISNAVWSTAIRENAQEKSDRARQLEEESGRIAETVYAIHHPEVGPPAREES